MGRASRTARDGRRHYSARMSTLIGYLILAAVGVLVVGAIWRPTWALALLLIQYPLEQLLQSYIVLFVQRNELFKIGRAHV